MVSYSPSDPSAPFSLGGNYGNVSQAMVTDPLCKRCHQPGYDVKVFDCGCCLHARCTPVRENIQMTNCPACQAPARSLLLEAMNFNEIDHAKAAAASMLPSAKRGKKRKNATIARLNPGNANVEEGGDGSDLRTGRWTTEETLYCDKLIEKFEDGSLPISDGIKLNDFLANMLKSKQSRLTKKMKNARLSAKSYKRGSGYIQDFQDASEFSQLERSFYESIQCDMERAEIRFHMQKEWREHFSTYCVTMGQKLEADTWLSSVEEMDRRASQAKDAARMARRKVMMGYALSQDSMNTERGVFIDRATTDTGKEVLSSHASTNSLTGLAAGAQKRPRSGMAGLKEFSSPFVGKVIQYLHRHQIPFEHIDAWVPSFVANPDQPSPPSGEQQNCRLCFAGFASTERQVPDDGGRPVPLSSQDRFDLLSFGEYSSKFSFDVGCGLPGRVYASGVCSWEQGVANAPSNQFERCGGASQWGIKTVLGVPIPSPNVGRIVVLLYSRHDRTRDPQMVGRITEELTKLMPTPKWKLVVDVGAVPPKPEATKPVDNRIAELLKLVAQHMPTHRNSPYSPYLPGFTSLRLLLMKDERDEEDNDTLSTILESYSSYLSSGRSQSESAWMVARDYMLLAQTNKEASQQAQSMQQQQQQQQPNMQGGAHAAQLRLHQQLGLQQQMMHQEPNSLQQSQLLLAHQQHGAQRNGSLFGQAQGGVATLQQAAALHLASEQQNAKTLGGFGSLNGSSHGQINQRTQQRQLAPSPGFSLQQSAFQPIGNLPSHQQH